MCIGPFASAMPKAPPAPPPLAPIQKPQDTTLPADMAASEMYRKKQKEAGTLNANSTLLTGVAGVNTSLLNLGKTTLLGG